MSAIPALPVTVADGRADDACDLVRVPPELSAVLPDTMTAGHWAWLFVGLGIIARLTRYLLNFPLWGDEYQLAANFLDRGFLELLQPLENNQVAPVGFLWVEAVAIRLFGFSEWSLRLFPVLCGIGSVLLFRQVASKLLRGLPFVLAVAIFSVAYYPIRLSVEVKPYACDMFVSLLLLWPTVAWWKNPDRSRPLWLLTALAPLGLSISFPAAFVAGGLSVGIAYTLWRLRRDPAMRTAAAAWVAFNLIVAIVFLGLMQINIAAQYSANSHDMTECWADSFPPWQQPLKLVGWLAVVHTSEMFAYPIGAENGGSIATAFCFALALWTAFRRPDREVALTVLAWFGLSFVAALMHRYPYGGHARLSQYLAPAICLLAGAGAALLLARLREQKWQAAMARSILGVCAVMGCAIPIRDFTKPYKDPSERDHRDFARQFWNAAPEERTVCLLTDLGVNAFEGTFLTPYLCNQRIYSPAHHALGPHDRHGTIIPAMPSADEPVRCVVFHSASAHRNDEAFDDGMREMLARYELVGTETHQWPLSPKHNPYYGFYLMCYDVYHLRPRSGAVSAVDTNPRH